MKKINYPNLGDDRENFNKRYIAKVSPPKIEDINCYLSHVKYNGVKLTFEKLAVLSFEELMQLRINLTSFSKTFETQSGNDFTDLFDYSGEHQNIAKFFRTEKTFDFKTCFYCNIDYINSFQDLRDYKDGYEFLNDANENELRLIYDLGEQTAFKILDFRTKYGIIDSSNVHEIGLNKSVETRILSLSIDNSHDHFTLDHFLPQKDYPFYSLCLYNFVPSCYSCNSKFKKALVLTDGNWEKVSPTSDFFSLDENCSFQVRLDKSIEIKSISDFNIYNKKHRTGITKSDKQIIDDYFKMFKIEGRYSQHKDQILHLIIQRKKYPDEKIKSLSQFLKVSKTEVKKLLFGRELFEPGNKDVPLIKFKKDIACQLRII